MKISRSWLGVLLGCSLLLIVGCSGVIAFFWAMHTLMRHPPIPTDDQLTLRTLKGHTDQVARLGFTSDGNRLVSVSDDRTAKVWNVASWTEAGTFGDHKDGIMSLALCRNHPFVATGDGDSGVILWDVNTCRQKASMSHPEFIEALAFDPDESNVLVVTYHVRHSLIRWDYRAGTRSIIPGEWDHVVSATLPPLGQIIITSGVDGSIVIWDQLFSRKIQTLPIRCSRTHLLSPVSRNGRLAVSCRNTIIIWDLNDGKKICEFESPWMNTISSICLSPSGNYLVLTGCVIAYEPGMIEIFDATSGKLLRRLRAHESIAHSSAISPDEHFLVTGGGQDSSIKIWSLRDLLSDE